MMFFQTLGKKKCQGIKLAVMDMWIPFRNATLKQVPGVSILFDKFGLGQSAIASPHQFTLGSAKMARPWLPRAMT